MDLEKCLKNYQGMEDVFYAMMEEFLRSYPAIVSLIREAVKNTNGSALQIAAHTLKGAVSNFFAEEVRFGAQSLEEKGKSGNLHGSEEDILILIESLKVLEEQMRGVLAKR